MKGHDVIALRHHPFGGRDNPVSEQQVCTHFVLFNHPPPLRVHSQQTSLCHCQWRSANDGAHVTNPVPSSVVFGRCERPAAARGSPHDSLKSGSILCTALQEIVRHGSHQREPPHPEPPEKGLIEDSNRSLHSWYVYSFLSTLHTPLSHDDIPYKHSSS
jgi:hypothetical protein